MVWIKASSIAVGGVNPLWRTRSALKAVLAQNFSTRIRLMGKVFPVNLETTSKARPAPQSKNFRHFDPCNRGAIGALANQIHQTVHRHVWFIRIVKKT